MTEDDDVDSTTAQESAATGSEAEAGSGACDVFVSYRIDPDERLARALQRLLESSIEPTPQVFVSGAGGIRPSSIGLKPQIQAAARTARAFVGVITPDSRDREWLHFEAGAAWGRNQMYAPVLVSVEPKDLGTTIADYVATRASSTEEMARLVESIASTLGSNVRPRFAKRYAGFERQLREQPSGEEKGEPTPITRAIRLWFAGKRDESRQLLSKCEGEAPDAEGKADTRIHLLSLEHNEDRAGFVKAFQELGEPYRGTVVWRLWAGILAGTPHTAIDCYDAVLAATSPGDPNHETARELRISMLYATGRSAEATAALIGALSGRDRSSRAPLVRLALEHVESFPPLARLLLLASASRLDHDVLFRELTDLAIDGNWPSLAVFAARRHRSESENGTSFNNLGRAYSVAKLRSLAHLAFRDAANAGVTVAIANMANDFRFYPVPAAGLRLLREHTGEFDATDPGYPHTIRGEIEALVATEEKRGREVGLHGFKTLVILAELADKALVPSPTHGTSSALQIVTEGGVNATLARILPLPNAWVATSGIAAFFVESGPGKFEGVAVDIENADSEPMRVGARIAAP